MNNGGFVPSIRQGEIARLEKILDRIDSGEAPELIHKWVDRQSKRLGEQGFDQWMAHRATEDLGVVLEHRLHHAMLATLPDETRAKLFDKSQSILFQGLIEQGFKPGKDFSCCNGGLVISDEAKEFLFNQVPAELHTEILKDTSAVSSNPWEKLEERLGVPFRANLLLRVDELIEVNTPPEALACWMANTNAGIANQVVADSDDPTLLAAMLARVRAKHPDLYQQILAVGEAEEDWSVEQLMDYGIYPLTDVLRAAGGSEDNGEISSDGEGYSRQGLERLALVWRGDRYSLPELIGIMDQHLGNGGQAA